MMAMVYSDTALGGALGAAITTAGAIIMAWVRKKPESVSLQEAANSAVQTALNGYKDYIQTMTSSYERRIEALTKEYEEKIGLITSSYELRITGLTDQIHHLRVELRKLTHQSAEPEADSTAELAQA
jgi:hypothetical protein